MASSHSGSLRKEQKECKKRTIILHGRHDSPQPHLTRKGGTSARFHFSLYPKNSASMLAVPRSILFFIALASGAATYGEKELLTIGTEKTELAIDDAPASTTLPPPQPGADQ